MLANILRWVLYLNRIEVIIFIMLIRYTSTHLCRIIMNVIRSHIYIIVNVLFVEHL